jgi:hypothetical protein
MRSRPGRAAAFTSIRAFLLVGTALLCGHSVAPAQIIRTQIFRNTQSIAIRDTNTALPYPSTISVAGVTGVLLRASVTLSNLAHTWPDDIDALVVSPDGKKVKVMSDAGGSTGVTNLSFTLDSSAGSALPDDGPLTAGTFRPADYEVTADTFASPAPGGPYETNLNVLAGSPANGDWKLYVVDDARLDTGAIARGWSISLVTSNYIAPPAIATQPQTKAGKLCGSATFAVSATGTAPLTYQWRFNGTSLPGANLSTLVLTDLGFGDAGDYSVVVSNAAGFVISSNATLTINNPTQGSDTIADATPICSADLDWFSTSGHVSTFDPSGPIFNPSVWWTLKPAFTQTVYLDTTGSSVDTAINVYRDDLGSLSFVSGSGTRPFGPLNDSSAFLPVTLTGGQTYYVAVLSESGFAGSYRLYAQRAQPAYGGFAVVGVAAGGVMTNGDDLDISINAYGLMNYASLRLLDRGALIYQRDQQQVNGASQLFHWPSPAPGFHSLTLQVVSEGFTNVTPSFDFLGVGKEVGFDRFEALPPQTTNTGTVIAGTIVVRNHSPLATGPLRVRCVLGSTAYQRQTQPTPPPPEELMPAFPAAYLANGNGSLAPGSIWAVSITPQMAVVCPFFEGGFAESGRQYHVWAILEENESGQWVAVDRAKLFSSEPIVLFPPNEGQIGQDGELNTTQVTYVQPPLLLQAPTSFYENNTTSLVAQVRLSNNTTNVVAPAWSVNPPFSVDATGRLSAPWLAANSNALVTATYTRSIQTLTAGRTVAVLKLPTPEVLRLESAQVTAGRFKVIVKGAASTTYQILSGADLASLSLLQSVTTDAQGQALLDVPVINTVGGRFFKAQRTFP